MDNTKVSGLLEISNALSVAVSQDLMNREHAKQVWNRTLDLAGINTPKPVFLNQTKQIKPEAKVETKAEVKSEVKVESPKIGE